MGEALELSHYFDSSSFERPLEACLRWIDEHREQRVVDAASECTETVRVRFVAVSHQRAAPTRTYYDYEALALDELRARVTRASSAPRTMHEIVGSGVPVRGYADLDGRLALDDFNRRTRAICERFDAAARRQLGVARTRVSIFDASSDAKCSRHLVWALEDEGGGEVAFRSSAACGRFVRELFGADEELVDLAVYAANHSLRMYGSTKLGDDRPFVALDADSLARVELPASRRLDWPTMRRSLVTLVGDEARLVGADAAPPPPLKRARSLRSPSPTLDCDLVALAERLEPIRRAGGVASLKCRGELAFVECRERPVCEHKGATHSSATVYYLIDVERGRYRQACHAASCKRSAPDRRRWSSLDDDQPFAREQVAEALFAYN